MLKELAQVKIEVQSLGVVIAAKDTTITYQRLVNADIQKNAKKVNRKKWRSGFGWGCFTIITLEVIAIGLVLVTGS